MFVAPKKLPVLCWESSLDSIHFVRRFCLRSTDFVNLILIIYGYVTCSHPSNTNLPNNFYLNQKHFNQMLLPITSFGSLNDYVTYRHTSNSFRIFSNFIKNISTSSVVNKQQLREILYSYSDWGGKNGFSKTVATRKTPRSSSHTTRLN